jgi:hypothetical protein
LGTGWDEAEPLGTAAHGVGMYEIRDLRMGVRIRVNKEHVAAGATSAGGEHKQGSAVCWAQASAPTTKPDGATALAAADIGRIWLDTTNNALKVLTAVSTNVWTPIGQILLATYSGGSEPARGLYMKGNELYFKGADAVEKLVGGLIDEDDMASDSATQVPSQQSVKAFVTAGTVTMTNKRLTGPVLISPASTGGTFNSPALESAVLNTALSGSAVLDEDDMASNSATKTVTQQSVKAFVEAESSLGAWASKLNDTAYLAATDGFVCATSPNGSTAVNGYTDGSNPPTTLVLTNYSNGGAPACSITLPVRKGNYWEVTGATTILWIPLGQ